MKYLLVLVVILVAYMLWRNAREAERRERNAAAPPPRPAPPPVKQDIVSCPVCTVHLPKSEAVRGANGLLYCSQEHRLLGDR